MVVEKRIGVLLDPEEAEQLEQLCKALNLKQTQVCRKALAVLYDQVITKDLWRGMEGYRITFAHKKSEGGKKPVIVKPDGSAKAIDEI